MFTGIIESLGTITDVQTEGTNRHFTVATPFAHELQIDQSVAHDGVCLTVVAVDAAAGTHTVTAIDETLQKTNLGKWQPGRRVNLERCLSASGRFDGHIVQGHVDLTATCESVTDQNGSWVYRFRHEPGPGRVTVEKGSISINGTSLTCFDSTDDGFSVAIIPYTYEHTTFQDLRPGDLVNLEFDIVGKYVAKLLGK
ncbi:riboflavin synthase subunit alpha [Hymenobacter qilianensis]|uniref:Riboflavin synthase subunit alpha n=2 Tax=Hymenobacter qilianensis TaxID=1385715 RepID=A0ACB5PUQ2_9BACT|nr:riboflavin synthase [Hymenobacter qilianensis]QNP51595.1 riboflavin synthase [Hymenobacter qilianensis]GGF73669.1 riboflavin synthase subunit alpha [Hymenobacter qilianensis]